MDENEPVLPAGYTPIPDGEYCNCLQMWTWQGRLWCCGKIRRDSEGTVIDLIPSAAGWSVEAHGP